MERSEKVPLRTKAAGNLTYGWHEPDKILSKVKDYERVLGRCARQGWGVLYLVSLHDLSLQVIIFSC